MKTRLKTTLLVAALLLLGCTKIWATSCEFQHATLWSFETIDKSEWTLAKGHNLSTSHTHYKHGEASLHWQWKKKGQISLNQDINFIPFDPTSEDKSIPTFSIWIYNETAVDDKVRFVFSTDDTENCSFTFKLNFTGWRSAWVAFERDMQGKPVSTMNRLTIESPTTVNNGDLYIDHLFLCTPADSRHHTPDHQVPFVNAETTSNWLIQQGAWYLTPDIALHKSITAQDKKDISAIENRFRNDILRPQKVSAATVKKLQQEVDKYEITRKNGQISGRSIWFGRLAELYIPLKGFEMKRLFKDQGVDLGTYFDLMLDLASAHANSTDIAQQDKLESLFMDMYDHMVDQGVACGSGFGTIHHYGYNWRSYYRSLYLMRNVLAKHDELENASQGMQWFAAVGEVFAHPTINGIDMDAFNTQVMGRLSSILIMDNSPKKVQYLQSFARWIDYGLRPAPGLNDAFKIDGSSYHHANNYPAYATGGLDGATRMVNFLSGTSFSVSELSHKTLKKALMTMRFYCNKKQWPVSFSGRHPRGIASLKPSHYAILAEAGSPETTDFIDKDLAQAYLRLMADNTKDKQVKKFKKAGLKAETTPQGHISMPYACSSTHRRDNWSTTIRAHSRYLWASEHYLGANYYARYMAHGSLQIMTGTNEESGYVMKGWDWNHFPGITAINLPVDELEANILNVDQHSGYEEMLFSDEAFAGGLKSNDNGVFAFKLHEHDKYQGSLRARKSYFFLDGKIICLGSNIENTNTEGATETTVYQNHNAKEDKSVQLNTSTLSDESFTLKKELKNAFIIDNKGNGYLVAEGNVTFKQGLQHSKEQAKRTDTQGVFTSAMIQHGKAPKQASYHYVVVPQTTAKVMSQIAAQPDYKVLAQDSAMHIVEFDGGHIGYTFFETAQQNNKGLIVNTNRPCLAMSHHQNIILELDVCNPDLTLYEGPADEIYKDGKRVERSIYSRPWRSHESITTNLELEIEGLWSLTDTNTASATLLENGNTLINIKCKDGASYKVTLEVAQ